MLKVQVTKNSSGENVQVTANNRDKTRKSLEGLSATRRIEGPVNKSLYERSLEEKTFFSETISQYAQSLCVSHGLDEIFYKAGNFVFVNFTIPESLNTYFQNIKAGKEARWFRRFKTFGEDWGTFTEYLESKDLETRNHIQKHFEPRFYRIPGKTAWA